MTRDLKTAILIEGLDDWVPLVEVDLIAKRLHQNLDRGARHELIIMVMQQLMDDALAEPGTVTEKDGYSALREPTSDVIQRVRGALLDENPDMWGYAIWLNNTPAGDAFARAAEATDSS
jgi:hypothetical protein